jgi:hypothetical protein
MVKINATIIIGIILIFVGVVILLIPFVLLLSIALVLIGIFRIRRGIGLLDESSIITITNYLSGRKIEIQEGTYNPSFDQIKELPELKGVKQKTFNIARNKWYKQNLNLSYGQADTNKLRGKRNLGVMSAILGVIIFIAGLIYGIFSGWTGSLGAPAWVFGIPFGIFLLVSGIIAILYYGSRLAKEDNLQLEN